jgi:hypothetical protein
MRLRLISITALILIISAASGRAVESKFFKEFKRNYSILDQDLLNNPGEVGEIRDFVYQKDVATFTFSEGKICLLRYVDGRPTTAIFVGKGNVRIGIPSHVERQSLLSVSKDSLVNQAFLTCFIRIGDDFDLRLKEKFSFKRQKLDWKEFNITKQAQGELFFKPIIDHPVDNYFELLRSVYERSADGYFWVNFNRYVFNYDPNRSEQVRVCYQSEGSDIIAAEAAVFQCKNRGIVDDSMMSDIAYPTTCVEKTATLEMGGLDGMKIDNGRGDISLVLNTDSAKFVSLYLHHNLKIDSLYFNGNQVEFYRRKDFAFIGVILPKYAHKGDTLNFSAWYRGFNFVYALPYVENPRAVPHSISFIYPKGFNYIVPDWGKPEPLNDGRERLTVYSSRPYDKYYFQGFAGGYDTLTVSSAGGMGLNILQPTQYSPPITENTYVDAIRKTFDFLSENFGGPAGAFELYVYPNGMSNRMPGLAYVPYVSVHEDLGGFHSIAAPPIAGQWLSAAAQPASYREIWIVQAVQEYLSLMAIQNNAGGEPFYTNLLERRNALYTVDERGRDMPLAVGTRALPTTSVNKGAWMLHMLRWMMFDLSKTGDALFTEFLHQVIVTMNSRTFTNADFVRLAEKYYGGSLEPFFRFWLYGIGMPDFNVTYTVEKQDQNWYVIANVDASKVPNWYTQPVMMAVIDPAGTSYARKTLSGKNTNFKLGPFTARPTQFNYNFFYSVLSRDAVKAQ